MRSIFRSAAAIAASASLAFFWSCERHEVGELPDPSHHAKAGEGDHGKTGGHDRHDHDKHGHADKSSHVDDKPNPSDGGAHMHGTGTPAPGSKVDDPHLSSQAIPPVGTPAMSPAGTPVQFFPSPTPR